MSAPERFGNRKITKMHRQWNDLRTAIRSEGTPAIQDAWDKVEEWSGFVFTRPSLPEHHGHGGNTPQACPDRQ